MYKVQTKTQSKSARIGFTVLLIASIFVACFMATQALLTAVYGLGPLEAKGNASIQSGASMPAEYIQTIEITNEAAKFTSGYVIDDYIQNIKLEICPTLSKNITAEAECMNL